MYHPSLTAFHTVGCSSWACLCGFQTYRGHVVQQTLIRAHFGPTHSTGRRYVYSGMNDRVLRFSFYVCASLLLLCTDHERLTGYPRV
jgi:hypothetical protein